MNAYPSLSIIALTAWLVLALAAFRAHRIGARRALVLGLTWLAIFILIAAVFAAIGT